MKKTTKILLSVTLVCVLAISGWLYIDYKLHCKTYFPSDTIINGIDCSGMTKEKAKDVLTDTWNKKEFVIFDGEEEIGRLQELNFSYAIDDQLEEIRKKGYYFPLYTYLFKNNDDLTVSMKAAEETEQFQSQVDDLPIYDQDEPVETKDAYIDMSNHKFTIVPEVYGNNTDKNRVKSTLLESIAQGKWELQYVEKDFYAQPEVKADSQQLLDKQSYCKTYLAHEITYNFGNDHYTIKPEEMDQMMTADDAGKITTNEKAVKKFVSTLADTYDTVDTIRSFKSTARGDVTIYGGTYGYAIDKEKEAKQLAKDLKALKNTSREPVYSQEGWGWHNNGFGSTYVEVDLSLQQLWYYQDGKILMTCPFVSGCVATNHETVTGAFQIAYMTTDVTLKGGSKKKKTYYESHVDYWMPFYGDYGLHDADWRNAFGGKIYIKGGSHGCVNMPPASAAQLYDYATAGTPVIVFY